MLVDVVDFNGVKPSEVSDSYQLIHMFIYVYLVINRHVTILLS